jgi:phosphate transport system substrate-binding protein
MRSLNKILICALCSLCSLSAMAADLTIAGSSTVFPVINEAAKTYTAAKITVGQGGSSDGIKKVLEGTVTIAMASRALKDEEVAKGLFATVIGTDGIAVICNKANPVTNLTTDQIRGAYTGTVTNWSGLGGSDLAIVLVSPHEQHGTTEGFAHHFGMQFKGDGTTKTVVFALKSAEYGQVTAIRTATHQESAAKAATNPAALVFMPIGAAEGFVAKGTPIKLLSLDGKIPTTAGVKDGSWPVIRSLSLVTKGPPAGDAKAFIDYMLSEAGQAVMVKNSFVGVK